MPTDPIIPVSRVRDTPGQPPIFERIGIVGLGLIGGSIALAARQLWPAGLVIGVDRNDVLEQAVARHAIDVAASELTIISEADLVVLAAPVLDNLAILRELSAYIEKPAVVTDVGSTKREIVRAASTLPPHLTFVGGHPLAGSTGRGVGAARPDLFGGRPWVFTPEGEDEGRTAAVRRLFGLVEALGARPHLMTADAHDHLVAFISHLPQLTASALMQVVGEAAGEPGLSLAGRGLVDTTRLAGSPAEIWADICDTNADEIGPALDALVDALQQVRARLGDRDAVTRLFEAASRWRGVLTERAGKADTT